MANAYQYYKKTRYFVDIPILIIGYWLSIFLVEENSIITSSKHHYFFIVTSIFVWYGAAYISHLYADRRSSKFSEEIIFIIYNLIIYIILLGSVLFFLKENIYLPDGFFLVYLSLLFITVTTIKYIIRKYLHSVILSGKVYDRVLLVGATPGAFEFYDTIKTYPYYGYKCVGLVNDNQIYMNGTPLLGTIKELDQILQQTPVEEVVVALPKTATKEIETCIQICDVQKKKVRMIPDLFQYASSTVQINKIGLAPVINIKSLPLDRWENKLMKRAFDIAFSILFFLMIGWWMMPLIALMIKVTSRGPVLFRQERWGLNNEKIVCYKFRTMYKHSSDVDENGKYVQATKDDPRVTWFGKILRKTNLDELPQFWNVLAGNMSVVGPRPHPTPLNLESMETVDNYMLRHLVLPGITGWAQVNGCRGETAEPGSMQKRVNFDLYYIHRWTFWLDCQIILQTLINIIRGDQNAY